LNKSQKGKEVVGEGISNPDAIVGRVIFTSWTRDMTLLSKGTVPTKWREDTNAVWIRKCKLVHFDKVVGKYKLRYLCGYERMVHEAVMSEIMEKHCDFSKAKHSNILAMVNDAKQEEVDFYNKWKTTYGSGQIVPSQPGAHSITINRLKGKGETVSGPVAKKKKFKSHAGVGHQLNIINSVKVLPVKGASANNVVSSSSNCGSSSNTSPNKVLQSAAVVVSAPEEGRIESSTVHVVQSEEFSVAMFPLHPNNDNTSCWINTGMQVIC
jgi:hypothetical protein